MATSQFVVSYGRVRVRVRVPDRVVDLERRAVRAGGETGHEPVAQRDGSPVPSTGASAQGPRAQQTRPRTRTRSRTVTGLHQVQMTSESTATEARSATAIAI